MRSRRRFRLSNDRRPRQMRRLWSVLVLTGLVVGALWLIIGGHRQPEPHRSAPPPAPLPATSRRLPPAALPPESLPEGAVASDVPPYPRPARSLLEAQIALDRQGISPGSLDGLPGAQTRLAILAFQQKLNLPPTGLPDAETRKHLLLVVAPLSDYDVTSNDLARLQPLGKTWTAKSQQSALEYETVLELVAEKSHSHPACIRGLNPNADWTNLVVGTTLQIPAVASAGPPSKAAFIRICIGSKALEAFDEETNLLLHFPCSIAQRVEKRPVGVLHIETVAPRPNYTFDPELFPESPESQQKEGKLVLPPGPNNPVGTVWIGLDRTGYGIHGTPNPEQVGRTESHGCFRLANWNVERLLGFCWIGMPVYVEP